MEKPIYWIADSRDKLKDMPAGVQDEFGYALDRVQNGETPGSASKMKGDLSEVMEIRADEGGDTFRTMYTVKLEGVVYVLDAFKKKSKRGNETPRAIIDRIRNRLKVAKKHHKTILQERG